MTAPLRIVNVGVDRPIRRTGRGTDHAPEPVVTVFLNVEVGKSPALRRINLDTEQAIALARDLLQAAAPARFVG